MHSAYNAHMNAMYYIAFTIHEYESIGPVLFYKDATVGLYQCGVHNPNTQRVLGRDRSLRG